MEGTSFRTHDPDAVAAEAAHESVALSEADFTTQIVDTYQGLSSTRSASHHRQVRRARRI